MRLKNLLFFFLILCNVQIKMHAQDDIKTVFLDTLSYSEENSQKVIELGQLIETSVHESDAKTFVSKLNKDKFFDRVFNDYQPFDREDTFIKGYMIGMVQGLKSFPNEIIMEVENGAYYDFINYRYDVEAQTYYALFRFFSAESGMNYHDFRVHKGDEGLEFSDIYIYLTGEHFTSTISRVMSYTLPEDSILKRIDPVDNPDSKELFKAILYNKNGDYEKAYSIIDGITSDLSKEKFLLILKTLIAGQLDDDKYLKSLEDLISAFPQDQTIALNKIDYHIYKEEYFEAIQVINQLQNETEDDFLNYLKAGVAFEDKNYDLALNLYNYTITNYPDFFEGQAGYLSTLVLMENYPESANYLTTLVAEGYDKQALIEYVEEKDENGENMLDGFANSKDFSKWKKRK
ncbi:tetratricopeptide repeat protein [Psychroserpens sp. Hel_I_66]|uniref:tetratricopeptide repeat protein n=1 Tax=Psychroserpens sp. Hel_I_66 TaxID=1250004 RepID=UPI0012E0B8F4|nr:hypothetical protein [Psychroserpens sp. Hel_I_66]